MAFYYLTKGSGHNNHGDVSQRDEELHNNTKLKCTNKLGNVEMIRRAT